MGHHACKRTDRTPDPEPLTGGPHGTPSVQKDRKEPCRGHPITTRPNQRHPTDHHPSEPKTTRSPPVQAPRPTHATRAWGVQARWEQAWAPRWDRVMDPPDEFNVGPRTFKAGGACVYNHPLRRRSPCTPEASRTLTCPRPQSPQAPPDVPWTVDRPRCPQLT